MTDGISRYPPTGYLHEVKVEPVAPRDFGGMMAKISRLVKISVRTEGRLYHEELFAQAI